MLGAPSCPQLFFQLTFVVVLIRSHDNLLINGLIDGEVIPSMVGVQRQTMSSDVWNRVRNNGRRLAVTNSFLGPIIPLNSNPNRQMHEGNASLLEPPRL